MKPPTYGPGATELEAAEIWLERLGAAVAKARLELATDGEPGRRMAEVVAMTVRTKNEAWHDAWFA